MKKRCVRERSANAVAEMNGFSSETGIGIVKRKVTYSKIAHDGLRTDSEKAIIGTDRTPYALVIIMSAAWRAASLWYLPQMGVCESCEGLLFCAGSWT